MMLNHDTFSQRGDRSKLVMRWCSAAESLRAVIKTFALILTALFSIYCGPGSMPAACVPGSTAMCACAGGTSGVQTCNPTGTAFGLCVGCDTPDRCGDSRCGGTETCATCAVDCGACAARCGDAICNGAETCASCAMDCRCPTPICGDGACNGVETCTSCADDCGRCPPRCGDAMCNGTETCATCESDCGTCGTTCMACTQDVDCPIGRFCGRRRCDGTRGCYIDAEATGSCSQIGGISCPPTNAYNLCIGNAECGPFATCARFGDGRAYCSRRCTVDTDCPAPPVGSTTTRRCDMPTNRCYLRCGGGPGTCPFGLSCFRFDDGTYGYCS